MPKKVCKLYFEFIYVSYKSKCFRSSGFSKQCGLFNDSSDVFNINFSVGFAVNGGKYLVFIYFYIESDHLTLFK